MKMAIVQKGLSQLQEIIQKSNGDMNAIGGRIRALEQGFLALGNQKFANREGAADRRSGWEARNRGAEASTGREGCP
jgi:hypothetical protein